MSDFKTVEGELVHTDPSYDSRKKDVSKMRASLLACSEGKISPQRAIQNITTLRIYHQISRIIRYLDQMDKIEEKLYLSMDVALDELNPGVGAVIALLDMQERLQKIMIDSHKLLQPYLDLQEYTLDVSDEDEPESNNLMSIDDRNRLRTNAQAVLLELERGESRDGSGIQDEGP